MYANSEDFQVLAITTMVSSFVAEWNDQNMKLHHGEDLNSAKYSARPRLAAVSYTHLDVYKRQNLNREIRAANSLMKSIRQLIQNLKGLSLIHI